MILVPFRGSGTRGDQVENARLFEKAGAAVIFTGGPSELARLISSLSEDSDRRNAMGSAKISGNDAAFLIAEEIIHRIRGEK